MSDHEELEPMDGLTKAQFLERLGRGLIDDNGLDPIACCQDCGDEFGEPARCCEAHSGDPCRRAEGSDICLHCSYLEERVAYWSRFPSDALAALAAPYDSEAQREAMRLKR